jgi:hypothetical protein
MKHLIASLIAAFALTAFASAPTKPPVPPAENTNCVKKDKNGKCPALPNSPKPTPKKKPDEKKS